MSDRMDRVNSLIKREVGLILEDNLRDKCSGFVTVLRADISRDLRTGRIFVSIFGSEESKKQTVEMLNENAWYIQKIIGSRVRLRNLPKLRFIYDDVIDHSIHIQEVLKEIKEKQETGHTDQTEEPNQE